MIMTVEVFDEEVEDSNAYFYIDDETNYGFLIDAGAEASRLLSIIAEKNFTIEKILLTHGHIDHIGAANDIQRRLKIPVCMHKNGKIYAENPDWNGSENFRLENVTYLESDTEIILNANPSFKLKLIHVAGHTTDGAVYYSEKDSVAFSGDSIAFGSYGRTDFLGGDDSLFKNVAQKILTLPAETILFPGHGRSTTVKTERLRSWFKDFSAEFS